MAAPPAPSQPAPSQPAHARPGVRTVVLGNPAAQELGRAGAAVKSQATAVVGSFRSRPGQSTALALGYAAW